MVMTPVALPNLNAVAARYAALPLRPLRVVLTLEDGSNLVSYDPLNLDNLLARVVLEEIGEGRSGYQPADDEYLAIPVPLAVLWREPGSGLPLYAAAPFVAEGVQADDVVYWHKRPQEGAFTRTKSGAWSPKQSGLRYSERRIPTPVVVAERWTAACVGNPEEVSRLLGGVTAVGKRRGAGHGVVREWQVEAAPSFALVGEDGRLARNLPEDARLLLGEGRWPEGEAAPLGWTPPQWRPALFRPGWRLGTPVHRLGGGAS